MQLLLDLEQKGRKCEWDWFLVSANPGITMQDIMKHPQYPWVWNQVIRNPNYDFNGASAFPGNQCSWEVMSFNPNLTIQDIINHPFPINQSHSVSLFIELLNDLKSYYCCFYF